MSVSKRNFVMGLGIGVALAMLIIQLWGMYLDRAILAAAQPDLLRPLQQKQLAHATGSSLGLPRAWFPETSGRLHDDWQVRPLDGKPLKLAELKGKVVFVNFWATTCAPCIAEMPGIARLSDSLKNEPVAFLAVTREDSRLVHKFLDQHPLGVPVYISSAVPPADLAPAGYPTSYILDRNGDVLFRHVGPLNWDDENARTYIRSLEQ